MQGVSERFEMWKSKQASTPMKDIQKLEERGAGNSDRFKLVVKAPYREVIGCFMYFMI